MKRVLFTLLVLGFGMQVQAQTSTKKDTKSISEEINGHINKMDSALTNTDWDKIQRAIDTTAIILERNAEHVVEVVSEIDLGKLLKTMQKVGEAVEKEVNTEKIEEGFNKISESLDKAIKEIAEDLSSDEKKAEKTK